MSTSQGRRQAELDAAAEAIGRNVTAVRGDVSIMADLDRLYATIRRAHGQLDVLFANAGGGAFVPLEQVTEEHFDRYFGINVKGTLFTVQKALPLMPPGSAIVLNASMVAVQGVPRLHRLPRPRRRRFARSRGHGRWT